MNQEQIASLEFEEKEFTKKVKVYSIKSEDAVKLNDYKFQILSLINSCFDHRINFSPNEIGLNELQVHLSDGRYIRIYHDDKDLSVKIDPREDKELSDKLANMYQEILEFKEETARASASAKVQDTLNKAKEAEKKPPKRPGKPK